MKSKFYALCLFLACLAAAMLGYALGGQVDTSKPLEVGKNAATSSDITDLMTVQEYGVEAQGTYLSYNDYEAHVAEIVNDRRAKC